MKNFLGFALLVIVFLTSCDSTKKAVTKVQEQTFAANENALLWKVSGKDLKESSYVFGTIHMIDSKDFFLTDAMKNAFAESDRIVFEINMEEMNSLGVLFTMMRKFTMEGGQTLKDLLSEEDYNLVKTHFKDIGIPVFLLEKVKPLFLSTFASGDMEPGALESGTIKSYEMEFMQMAQKDKKEMGGLETVEFQLSMFDSIPYKAQADMLVDAIKNSGEGDDQFAQMVAMYKRQDLAGLYKMIQGDTEGVGEFEDLLLVGRNKNWIPLMEGMMANKKTFFAVGAGHLGGENGVVALLRKQGYIVTAVDPVKPRP